MYDGSHEPDFETNLKRTEEVVRAAHAKGISVEAEALSEAANNAQATTVAPATKAAATTTKAVSNASSDAWVRSPLPTPFQCWGIAKW